jgi:hypothetical protein
MRRLILPKWVEDPTWLDDDNAIRFIIYKDQTEPYGSMWYHLDRRVPETGKCCFGSFAWRSPSPEYKWALWQLESLDPLTISPSLLCLSCEAHGFIRNSMWIPA